MEGITAAVAAAAAEAYIVPVYMEAVAVCLEIPPMQELDLSLHTPMIQGAVCSRQAV